MSEDVIDRLAGIAPGSALSAVREVRAVARVQAQASYDALFAPVEVADMGLEERFVVAAFVAGLHRDTVVANFYGAGAGGLAALVAAEAVEGRAVGPYGAFPAGVLSREDVAGPVYRAGAVGGRMGAALAHAHMLVFHPRDAGAGDLQALLDAGWSTTGIVTLSQLVSFLAFQIRVVAGLRVMNAK